MAQALVRSDDRGAKNLDGSAGGGGDTVADRDNVGGGIRQETYQAGAKLLGVEVESFRRLAIRKGWRRTRGNDGKARVAIPVEAISQREARPPRSDGDYREGGVTGVDTVVEPQALNALSDALRQERERREAAETAATLAQGEVTGLREAVRLAEAAVRAGAEREQALTVALDTARAEALAVTRAAGELEGVKLAAEYQHGELAAMRQEVAEAHNRAFVAEQAALKTNRQREGAEQARARVRRWTPWNFLLRRDGQGRRQP